MTARRDGIARLKRAARAWRVPAAVVTDVESFVGLQTARLLRSRGIPVVALTGRPGAALNWTRAVEAVLPAGPEGANTVDVLQEIGGSFPLGAVVFPCSDEAVMKISSDRASLNYRVSLPPHETIELLTDKGRFLEHASSIGIPVSPFRVLRARVDADAAGTELQFPVVLKPIRKNGDWNRRTGQKAVRVTDPSMLLDLWDSVRPEYPLLAQEWIVGGDDQLFSVNAYFGTGSVPLATFVAQKVRQWPPQVGISSMGQECRNDDVLNAALELFQSVPYRGLAYLEMKWDARSGRHLAIEANVGRPTGRSAIAEAGGVELIQTAYCDALGRALPDSRVQHYGDARWIYLSRDIASAYYYHKQGDLRFDDWWRSVRGIRSDAVFSWRDPIPFVLDLAAGLRRVERRR